MCVGDINSVCDKIIVSLFFFFYIASIYQQDKTLLIHMLTFSSYGNVIVGLTARCIFDIRAQQAELFGNQFSPASSPRWKPGLLPDEME